MTSQGSETKSFNHKADNEFLLLFLNFSVCWSGLPLSKQNSCLNLLKSTTIQYCKCCFFGKGKKRCGNVLELQRRDVNKLSGNCSRNYKFLQDTFKWGLWQLGTQRGWLMGLLTCRGVALRKPLWHMRSEYTAGTFNPSVARSTCSPFCSTLHCSIILTWYPTNCLVTCEHFCRSNMYHNTHLTWSCAV